MADRYHDRAAWIDAGIAAGWCSAPYCASHYAIPASAEEKAVIDAENGYDSLCLVSLRLWDDNPPAVDPPAEPALDGEIARLRADLAAALERDAWEREARRA